MRTMNAIILAGLATGCGNLSKTADKANKADDIAPELVGEWKAECFDATVLDLSKGDRKMNFNLLGDFEKVETLYLNDECQDSALKVRTVGSYSDLGELPENSEVKRINYTTEQSFVTVGSKEVVEILNATKICNKTDWEVNKETEITDLDCGPLSVEKGETIFDTYDVGNDTLLMGGAFILGQSNDSSDDRPSEVDQSLMLKKQ